MGRATWLVLDTEQEAVPFGAAELAARWSWVDLDHRDAHGGRIYVLGAGFNRY